MMRQFPYPPYEKDSFNLEGSFVKLMRLIFLFYIVNLVKDVTKDKEDKLKVGTRSHMYLIRYLN